MKYVGELKNLFGIVGFKYDDHINCCFIEVSPHTVLSQLGRFNEFFISKFYNTVLIHTFLHSLAVHKECVTNTLSSFPTSKCHYLYIVGIDTIQRMQLLLQYELRRVTSQDYLQMGIHSSTVQFWHWT